MSKIQELVADSRVQALVIVVIKIISRAGLGIG